MQPTVDPMVLGPLMIALTTAWFAAMSWAGMHEDDTPRTPTGPGAGDRGPWWTNAGFHAAEDRTDASQPARVLVTAERRDR